VAIVIGRLVVLGPLTAGRIVAGDYDAKLRAWRKSTALQRGVWPSRVAVAVATTSNGDMIASTQFVNLQQKRHLANRTELTACTRSAHVGFEDR
jgi:hypothetical protein